MFIFQLFSVAAERLLNHHLIKKRSAVKKEFYPRGPIIVGRQFVVSADQDQVYPRALWLHLILDLYFIRTLSPLTVDTRSRVLHIFVVVEATWPGAMLVYLPKNL